MVYKTIKWKSDQTNMYEFCTKKEAELFDVLMGPIGTDLTTQQIYEISKCLVKHSKVIRRLLESIEKTNEENEYERNNNGN